MVPSPAKRRKTRNQDFARDISMHLALSAETCGKPSHDSSRLVNKYVLWFAGAVYEAITIATKVNFNILTLKWRQQKMIWGVLENKVALQRDLKPSEDQKCLWHAQSFLRPANIKNNINMYKIMYFFIANVCLKSILINSTSVRIQLFLKELAQH